jgi:hypothetical protein
MRPIMKTMNVHGTMTRRGRRACPMFPACAVLVWLAGCGCDDTTATRTDGDVDGGEPDSAEEAAGDPGVECLEGEECAEAEYGAWSACGDFSDDCDTTGSRTRQVTRYLYGAGCTCTPDVDRETEDCTRETEGEPCSAATNGACCGEECVNVMVDRRHCGGCGAACGPEQDCCAGGRCGTVTLYGIDGDVAVSSLYRFNPLDATETLVGSTGVAGGDWGLAYDPNRHLLYAVNGWDDVDDPQLLRVDPDTGETAVIGPTGTGGPGAEVDGGLAFDPVRERLYYIAQVDSNRIYLLDTSTGAGTLLCELPFVAENVGVAFDPVSQYLYFTGYFDGIKSTLYAMTSIQATCDMIEACPSLDPYTQNTGLAWHPVENMLYAVEDWRYNVLFKVDMADCGVTTVGTVRPSNVEGIDFGCWITP